jgi:hypothetical protein
MTRLVHIKKEEYDILICRPSKWGNPYSSKENTLAKYKTKNRTESIEKYREYITKGEGKHLLDDLHELKNKRLGCWCYPNPCHGNVLISLLEGLPIISI